MAFIECLNIRQVVRDMNLLPWLRLLDSCARCFECWTDVCLACNFWIATMLPCTNAFGLLHKAFACFCKWLAYAGRWTVQLHLPIRHSLSCINRRWLQ